MAKDETEIGITGKPIPKKKRSPKKQHEFEKKRRENLGQNVGGRTYSSDVTPYFNPRSVREEVISYLLDEGFASDEKSAQAIAGAMSEEWRQSIVEQASTVASSGGAGGKVTVDKPYPATLGGKKGVKSTDAQGTEYFVPNQPQGGLSKPNTLPDLNKAQYKNTYTNTYKPIPASQSTQNPQSHLSRTGVPRVRSATRTYGID